MGGRSQLVIPVHLETEMTVNRLIDMGVGDRLVSSEEPSALAKDLDRLVQASEPIEAAMAVAHRIAERDLTHALDLTAEACVANLK
jgi:hypothetical protein